MSSHQDSLQDYFNDLLQGAEDIDTDEVNADKHSGVTPSAEDGTRQQETATAPITPASSTATQPVATHQEVATDAMPHFAEPELIAPERRRQIEKLLQTAKPLTVAESSPDTATDTSVKIESRVDVPVEAPIAEALIVETPVEAPVANPDQVVEVELAPVVTEEELQAVEPDVHIDDQALAQLEWLDNGRPAWAQNEFEVLLFQVSGLTLAVPLVALGQIYELTDELTPLFGQANWFMGLQPTPTGKIRTINTALFVMPERYDERFLETAQLVMSINGLPWGLAVDSVNQPITLQPDDVKWRSERSKRAWLAGTVKNHMCALIDVPQMGQLLQNADANHRA